MATETIVERKSSLQELEKRVVLDFVEFLEYRRAKPTAEDADRAWSSFCLSPAMRGIEHEESPYTLDDVMEFFT